jgi:colicin import membrane protein
LKKEKLEKEKLEKEKADKDKKVKEKLEATKAEKDAQRKQEEDKKAEAIRQESLKRVNGMLGATGAPNATGTAQHAGGPSASYAGRLKGRVKPNIIYPEISVSENPSAEVLVKLAPDGTIVSKKLTKPSGNSAWDTAVLKAIDKTERFPRDTDGSVPSEIVFTFTPNE